MKPEPLFYIEREEQAVAGPYDLVQMAGLLRRKIITADTPTRLEGEEGWKPFSWQPQFMVAREMSPDAVSTRIAESEEKNASLIPMPSAESLLKLGGAALGALLAGAGTFLVTWLDPTLGLVLEYAGLAAILLGQCLMVVQMLDENAWTLAGLFFVPFYDVYYLICNFWRYFPPLCIKYVGVAVTLGAVAGLAARATH